MSFLFLSLWELCNAEHSHISQVSVPILLHCITLPVGSDAFWKILQEFFHHSDWRVRFQAVERVTVIARFMDSTPLRTEVNLQTALATAFCHLIASMDDINVYVAQRATLYLGTIHDTAIRVSDSTVAFRLLRAITCLVSTVAALLPRVSIRHVHRRSTGCAAIGVSTVELTF